MTKKFTWFAILFTGLLLSGCSKDKTPPEVIESTVQNSGMDDKVKVETNAKGTSLTYKSWVAVDQVFATRTAPAGEESVVETRAAGKGTEISVLLTNRLKHSVDTASVEHYKLAQEPAVTLERRIGETYAEGYYITVVDSILEYRIDYGCFTEKFEMSYQVAFYNDGVTRFKLPHKSYDNFSAEPYQLTAMDSKMGEGGEKSGEYSDCAYAWKRFDQTLKVDFGGSEYAATARTFLRRMIASDGSPYVVRSEVLASELQPENDPNDAPFGAHFISKLKVRQRWSDGRDAEEEYTVRLFCEINAEISPEVTVRGDPAEATLQHKEVNMKDENDPWMIPNHPEFGKTTCDVMGELYLGYPAWGVVFRLYQTYAFYDDGVTYALFPGPEFTADGVTVVSDNLVAMPNEGEGWYEQTVKVRAAVSGATVETEKMMTIHFN